MIHCFVVAVPLVSVLMMSWSIRACAWSRLMGVALRNVQRMISSIVFAQKSASRSSSHFEVVAVVGTE